MSDLKELQPRILKCLCGTGTWMTPDDMRAVIHPSRVKSPAKKKPPTGYSKSLGNKHKHGKYWEGSLVHRELVDQSQNKGGRNQELEYRINEAGLQALEMYENDHGEVQLPKIVSRIHVKNLGDNSTTTPNLANDIVNILDRDIDTTEKQTLVSARVGQGRFRTEVLNKWNKRCAVTGTDLTAAIRASHIKPWKDYSDEERLDPDNGLPLVATLDALFDVGLISFNDTGVLLMSKELTEEQIDELNLRDQRLSEIPNNKTCELLAHHRQQFGFP